MSSLQLWRAAGVVMVVLAGIRGWESMANAAEPAAEDENAAATDREVRELVAFVKNKGFYGLRDPQEKKAIERLRQLSAQAAPAIAAMLAEGLKQRKDGWIEVYRPLYILTGMGEHAKVALGDIVQALQDDHSINVTAAAKLLEQIGPAAKEALPGLERAWKAPETKDSTKAALARAIRKIDPQAAEKLGIKPEKTAEE